MRAEPRMNTDLGEFIDFSLEAEKDKK